MSAYYSEFVRRCLRFYACHPDPKFKSEAYEKNWYACDNALKGFSDSEREMLTTIYFEGDTLPDNVYQMARKMNVNQGVIWKLMKDLERKVAKQRGLL